MFKQREAIIRLFRDDDPDTILLIKRQLVQGGVESIPDLKELLSVDDQKVTGHIRQILIEIEEAHARKAFDDMCQQVSTLEDLEQACWLLAQIFVPGLDIDSYRHRLDRWAEELRCRFSPRDPESARVSRITQFLGRELGFRGNAENYYFAKNSLLPCVMDSRLGIPISLSVLYMIVGKRAAMDIEGINLPGHFVVRHGSVLFDPFHEGRILTTRECSEILSQQKLTFHPNHLRPATPRLILIRMLANLLYIFEKDKEEESRQMVTKWIRLLEPK